MLMVLQQLLNSAYKLVTRYRFFYRFKDFGPTFGAHYFFCAGFVSNGMRNINGKS